MFVVVQLTAEKVAGNQDEESMMHVNGVCLACERNRISSMIYVSGVCPACERNRIDGC